jgi:hypothetical protein
MFLAVVITAVVVAPLAFVATLFVVKRNPKILSVIGAYDQLVKKVKEI